MLELPPFAGRVIVGPLAADVWRGLGEVEFAPVVGVCVERKSDVVPADVDYLPFRFYSRASTASSTTSGACSGIQCPTRGSSMYR